MALLDHKEIAIDWLNKFSSARSVDNLFHQDAYWRDILACSWDFRTFHGLQSIATFHADCVLPANLHSFRLTNADLLQLYPDITWIQGLFDFSIGDFASGAGVFRLGAVTASQSGGSEPVWKAHFVFTDLEAFTDHPEATGPNRYSLSNHGNWLGPDRRNELAFRETDPYVLVIGGGQNGIELAARLKFLNVPVLIVERHARIGDQWRKRYQCLCTNDPVWCDHLAYMPFPPTWPVFTPSEKLADWLEFYVETLELDVWLSSSVRSITRDPDTQRWNVAVHKQDGKEIRVLHPTHVVCATGMISSPNIPDIPGKNEFKGTILHSSEFHSPLDYPKGTRALVVGAGTSGHDISADFVRHGYDVVSTFPPNAKYTVTKYHQTMYQRSSVYVMTAKEGFPRLLGAYVEGGPPTAIADRIGASFPIPYLKEFLSRKTREVAEADRVLLDGLKSKGFQLNLGIDASGLVLLSVTRAGGYYIDHGASQLVVDGKIKFKSSDPRFSRYSAVGRELSEPLTFVPSDDHSGEHQPVSEEVIVPPEERTRMSELSGNSVGATGTTKQWDMLRTSSLDGGAVDTANTRNIRNDIHEDVETRDDGSGDDKIDGDGRVLIERFSPDGVKFTDGEEIPCDVVVYCTGFNGMEENIHKLLSDSPETVKQLKPFLGKFDEEWEYIGYWRDTGVENLWIMPGSLAVARYHSRHLALQIKAIKEGIMGERYSL